jgi:hypothetical protein
VISTLYYILGKKLPESVGMPRAVYRRAKPAPCFLSSLKWFERVSDMMIIMAIHEDVFTLEEG